MVLKKKLFLGGALSLLIVALGVYAYTQLIPNPGHGGDKVLVTINGFTMTLQEAINYGFLVDCAPEPTQSYSTSGEHTASEVLVTLQSYTDAKNLQEVLFNNLSLCGSYCLNKYDGSHSICLYTQPKPNPGHFASEILVSINDEEMTFQEAISAGKFCPISHYSYACFGDDVYWYDSCGNQEEVKEECGGCEIMQNCCCKYYSKNHGSEMKMYKGNKCTNVYATSGYATNGSCADYYSCGDSSCGSSSSLPYTCSGTPSSCTGQW